MTALDLLQVVYCLLVVALVGADSFINLLLIRHSTRSKSKKKIKLLEECIPNLYMLCYAKSLQSCPTPRDPIDGSPPGSLIPWILQARTLEWVAISFFNE